MFWNVATFKNSKTVIARIISVLMYPTPNLTFIQELVAIDEAVANDAAEAAGAIKAECEADLAEAIPALEAAIGALDTLKPADISQVPILSSIYL